MLGSFQNKFLVTSIMISCLVLHKSRTKKRHRMRSPAAPGVLIFSQVWQEFQLLARTPPCQVWSVSGDKKSGSHVGGTFHFGPIQTWQACNTTTTEFSNGGLFGQALLLIKHLSDCTGPRQTMWCTPSLLAGGKRHATPNLNTSTKSKYTEALE